MNNNNFLVIVSFLSVILSSCGSIKPISSGRSTVIITTNIKQSEISDKNRVVVTNLTGEYVSSDRTEVYYNKFNEYEFFKNDFSKKRTTLIVSHPYYKSDTIVIDRTLRPVVFTLDVLGAITLYLSPSLIIDMSNGNIWKVKKSDKNQNIQLSYNDIYYLARLEYAKEKGDIKSVENYILNFSESPYIPDAVEVKKQFVERDRIYDSIKVNGDYSSMEEFLRAYPNSIYQTEMQQIAVERFNTENKAKSFEWEKIGDYIRSVYNTELTQARQYSVSKEFLEAIKHFELAFNIYKDETVNLEYKNALDLCRVEIVLLADNYSKEKKLDKAIEYYNEAQKISYSVDVRDKLVTTINLLSQIRAENERQRLVDVENSAVKCVVCKKKIYKNDKGYYNVYFWNNHTGCANRVTEDLSEDDGILMMGPYCSYSCCDSKRAKSGRAGVHSK